GSLLNRYWDDRAEPRPESYRPDYELAQTVPEGQRDALYRNLRATAESGWDFSSRWMRDPKDLRTLETTQLVPVDLNSLLYHAEVTIAALRRVRGRPGDREVAERFARAAQDRRRVLLAAAYDPATGYFYDVRWQTGARGRWLGLNRRAYQATGKMAEKYDVVDLRRRAGGGEYPTEDGFGWTNGVALALEGTAHLR